MTSRPESRRDHLCFLFKRQNGKCHICGCDAVLDGDGGKANSQRSAVRFRLGSSFGAKGRVRPRVMACRKCAQERSDQIQESQPIEYRWLKSGRAPSVFYEVPKPPSEGDHLLVIDSSQPSPCSVEP